MKIIIWLIVFSSTLWVFLDSLKIKNRLKSENIKINEENIKFYNPEVWAFLCILLWIVFFPLYLSKREKVFGLFEKKEITNKSLNKISNCTYCKKFYEGDAIFCPNCGNKI